MNRRDKIILKKEKKEFKRDYRRAVRIIETWKKNKKATKKGNNS